MDLDHEFDPEKEECRECGSFGKCQAINELPDEIETKAQFQVLMDCFEYRQETIDKIWAVVELIRKILGSALPKETAIRAAVATAMAHPDVLTESGKKHMMQGLMQYAKEKGIVDAAMQQARIQDQGIVRQKMEKEAKAEDLRVKEEEVKELNRMWLM